MDTMGLQLSLAERESELPHTARALGLGLPSVLAMPDRYQPSAPGQLFGQQPGQQQSVEDARKVVEALMYGFPGQQQGQKQQLQPPMVTSFKVSE